jgi:hypothetical protein
MIDWSTPTLFGGRQFGSLLLADMRVPSLNILAKEMAFVGFIGSAVEAR